MKRLVVTAATLGYGRAAPVLREVSLAVEPGRMLAVTGPSGAGKTTLLSALAGMLAPLNGIVSLGDPAVGDAEPLRDRDHAVRAGIVLIPQDSGLAPILTAQENLQVVLIAGGATPAAARRETAIALDRLGLSMQADQLVEELSGGQQQRTAIARGLALVGLAPEGAVLLADEVTSELDAGNRQRVLELLRAEADRGSAVVLATHDPEASAACDAEIHLRDGTAEAVRGDAALMGG